MKERPILFNAPMVRAKLEGRKKMTRRVIKPQPIQYTDQRCNPNYNVEWRSHLWRFGEQPNENMLSYCPYGQPGDRLWVRETFTDTWELGDYPGEPLYRATYLDDWKGFNPNPSTWKVRWHPSIYMPRTSSRISLEITNVRVERLQDISQDDAKAEGLSQITKDGHLFKFGIPDRDGLPGTDNDGWPWSEWEIDPRKAFRKLWDLINAKRGFGWDKDPWVWVIEFK